MDVNSLPRPAVAYGTRGLIPVKLRPFAEERRGAPRVRASLRSMWVSNSPVVTLERHYPADVPSVVNALTVNCPRFGFSVLSATRHTGSVDFAGPGNPMLQNMRWIARATAGSGRTTILRLTGLPLGRSIGDLARGKRQCAELLAALDQRLLPTRRTAPVDGLARTAALRAELDDFQRRRI